MIFPNLEVIRKVNLRLVAGKCRVSFLLRLQCYNHVDINYVRTYVD